MSDKPDKPKELMFLAVLLVAAVGVLWVFSGFVFSVVAEFEAAQWLAAVSTLAIAVLTFILAFETLKMRKHQDEQIKYLLRREAAENFYKHQDRFYLAVRKIPEVPRELKRPEELHAKLFKFNLELGSMSVILPEELYQLADFMKKNMEVFNPENQPRLPLVIDRQNPSENELREFEEAVKKRWQVFSGFSSCAFECYQLFFSTFEVQENELNRIKDIDIDSNDGFCRISIDQIRRVNEKNCNLFSWLSLYLASDLFSFSGLSDEDRKVLDFLSEFNMKIPDDQVFDQLMRTEVSGGLVHLSCLEGGRELQEKIDRFNSGVNDSLSVMEAFMEFGSERSTLGLKPYYQIVYFNQVVQPAPCA